MRRRLGYRATLLFTCLFGFSVPFRASAERMQSCLHLLQGQEANHVIVFERCRLVPNRPIRSGSIRLPIGPSMILASWEDGIKRHTQPI
jgi:hypothetical protein